MYILINFFLTGLKNPGYFFIEEKKSLMPVFNKPENPKQLQKMKVINYEQII